jgi:hypothetical protein
MVIQGLLLTAKWEFDVVSIGFAGPKREKKLAPPGGRLVPGYHSQDILV